MEAEYITLYQTMRYFLSLFIIIKEIEFIIELQGENQKVLWSIFEYLITVREDNQGAVTLAVPLQIRPYTKHITTKYHHFRIFVANGDVEI